MKQVILLDKYQKFNILIFGHPVYFVLFIPGNRSASFKPVINEICTTSFNLNGMFNHSWE
jgi:hypothetical protein